MEQETIIPLVKNTVIQSQPASTASGCCGGTPSTNQDACCKLDEDKKAEGESGCGCNSTAASTTVKSSCCN